MPLKRLERTRDSYICHLCGTSTLAGQHGVYELDWFSMNITICKPIMFVRYPKYHGIITGIEEPK